MALTKVTYSMIEGGISGVDSLVTFAGDATNYGSISEEITLTGNVSIPSTKTLEVFTGGKIIVPTGLTLTIDAEIIAGDYQIFECTGTGKVVCTNNSMGNANYPIRTPHVKAIWFGVIPDAKYPTSATTDPTYGTVTLGQTPTGTDSSAALRMAVQYVQLNCVKAAAYIYTVTAPTLHLPAGQVLVEGNNILGNQYEAAEMASYYATADAGGNAETPSNLYRLNNYNFILEGHDCQLLWMVQSEFDILWDSGFLVNRIEARNFHVSPIVTTDSWGIFFRNKALTTYGTRLNYANALGPAIFENVNVVNAIVNDTSVPSNFQYRLKYVFWNEGYSRCDNFTVREGFYNGFNIFWKNDNPEAVDLRFENNMIQCDKAGSCVFEFSSFYDGFIASGNFFSFKEDDQTLLRELNATTQYIGASYYAGGKYYFPGGNRYEFKTGLLNFTCFSGYGSTMSMEGYNIGLGGLVASSYDAVIDGTSSIVFKDSFCAGGYQITSDARVNTAAAKPKVTYDNCGFFINGGLSGYTVNTGAGYEVYRNAIANASGEIPAVRFINQEGSRYSLNWPEYYGTWDAFKSEVKTKVTDRSIDGYSRYGTGNTWFLLPPLVKITSIKLWSIAGTFTSLDITFGKGTSGNPTYTLTTAIAGTAQSGLELITAGKCIMCPTNDSDYLYFMPTSFNGGSPVAGGLEGWLEFTYEPITDRQQMLPILGTDVAILVDNV